MDIDSTQRTFILNEHNGCLQDLESVQVTSCKNCNVLSQGKKDKATGVDFETCEVKVQTVIHSDSKEVQTFPLTCPHCSIDISSEAQRFTINRDGMKGMKVVETKSNDVLYREKCHSLLLNEDVMDALIE